MFFFFPLFKGSSIEVHYYFNDDSHEMDAIIQHRCEAEILGMIKAVAADFNTEVLIETAAFEKGGLKRWFKIISKSENKNAALTTAFITAIVTSLLITPLGSGMVKVVDKVIEKVFEDEEDKALDKEKKKAEIENIKADTKLKEAELESKTNVVKRRSNFYYHLQMYPRLEKLSVLIQDNEKRPQSNEIVIERQMFNDFILVSDELEPEEIDNATIEIISPVLKKGNYRWRGIYNGRPISFAMKSNEFRSLIQSGAVEFKNGTTIDCFFEFKRKLNDLGEVEITDCNVLRVNSYFINDNPIETQEGKIYRKKQEGDQQQLKLFSSTTSEDTNQ